MHVYVHVCPYWLFNKNTWFVLFLTKGQQTDYKLMMSKEALIKIMKFALSLAVWNWRRLKCFSVKVSEKKDLTFCLFIVMTCLTKLVKSYNYQTKLQCLWFSMRKEYRLQNYRGSQWLGRQISVQCLMLGWLLRPVNLLFFF